MISVNYQNVSSVRRKVVKKECFVWKAKKKEYEKKGHDQRAKGAIDDLTRKSDDDFEKVDEWRIDSGATSHMCNNEKFFSKLNHEIKEKIMLANWQHVISEGIAEGYIRTQISPSENKKI